ncbi:phage major capsid protein [Mycolicibacterium sp. S2-37]|uniref:phage major capsid protein n=1 Tax=Mycolicibacterium sp. S2-37 TaxID=2810297 RepID=UPI001A945FE4|nr:phage major capsid protein [Mycolicibacterium sp. S2-37]MBO0680336.1 phage major capsid protein [Mycolicibacterium sp. S2-37]
MSQSTINAASILRPEEVHELVIQPLTTESVAFQASTVVQTNSHDYRIPILTGDPDVGWTAEGAEITADDADLGEVVVTPRKVAGITVVSNELAADSSPEATRVIGDRLVQSLRRKIDAAWFGNTTANGPAGLGSIAASNVYAGVSYANLDAFLEAQVAAENLGQKVTAFVTNPNTVLALSKIKKAASSNEALLQPDPSSPSGRVIAGVPLLSSPDAPDNGLVWAVPQAVSFVVVRKDVEVVVDTSAFFTSDRVAIRAVARVGFGFPHEAALVKVNRSAAP